MIRSIFCGILGLAFTISVSAQNDSLFRLWYDHPADQWMEELPDNWKGFEIKGLRTYGGFVVDFTWEDLMVQNLTIESTIGGNCRIRVSYEMTMEKGRGFKQAKGENPNPFFETIREKDPLISNEEALNFVTPITTYLYDLPTKAGNNYNLF